MFRAADIQDKLLHLIGWEQNYNTAELKISEALTTSESGLYFQQVHPLLTLQNISSIAPDFANTVYPEYDAEAEYFRGNVVSYNNLKYKALQKSVGVTPDNIDYWVETNPLSEWLEQKTKGSIQKAIARFCNEKIVKGTYKPLCENKTLFDGTGRLVDTIANKHNLVGFEIVPIRAKGIVVKINRIGLQFTEPGEYTLYLMHSSNPELVKTIKVTKQKRGSLEWFSFDDLLLPYEGEFNDAGGSWFLCYKQSELPEGSMAIYKSRDWSKGPCSSCSRNEVISWNAWSKFIEVHPFSVKETSLPETFGLWDIDNNTYTYDRNYGINIDLSVKCDLTDFIVEQRMLFRDIIAKQVAIDMLREFAYNANVRTNRHTMNVSRLDTLYEIDGDSSSMKKSGLSYQLDMAYKVISLSTEGLDRACLPCKNNGVKYRTV